MAVIEQEVFPEVVREISVSLNRKQAEALAHAASVSGQSMEEFAASALACAAEEAMSNQGLPSAAESFAHDVKWSQFLRSDKEDRLDKIIGIFKDEPLMNELMERIREDRRTEIEQLELEADTED